MTDRKRRVRIEQDMSPEMPDDFDYQVPVIWVPYIGCDVRILSGGEYLPDVGALRRARGSLGWEQMERWLNIFVGKVLVRHEHVDRNGVYLEVASQDWLDAVTTDDWAPDLADYKGGEMLAYLEGEVYLLRPEVLIEWRDVANDQRVRLEWEDDDDLSIVCGYYGKDAALESAQYEFYDEHFDVVDEDGEVVFTKGEK